MKRSQRELLLKLVIFCDKSDYNVKEIKLTKGEYKDPHIAKCIDCLGKEVILWAYTASSDWMEKVDCNLSKEQFNELEDTSAKLIL
ncbi:MAG: hypothetical protein ACRDD7_14095 [Peptostreptococcaceae bacterium]